MKRRFEQDEPGSDADQEHTGGWKHGFTNWDCAPLEMQIKLQRPLLTLEQLSQVYQSLIVATTLCPEEAQLCIDFLRPGVIERLASDGSTVSIGTFWMAPTTQVPFYHDLLLRPVLHPITQDAASAQNVPLMRPTWKHALDISTPTIDAAWVALNMPPEVSFLFHAFMGAILEGPTTSTDGMGMFDLPWVPFVVGLDVTVLASFLDACLTLKDCKKPLQLGTIHLEPRAAPFGFEQVIGAQAWVWPHIESISDSGAQQASGFQLNKLQALMDGEHVIIPRRGQMASSKPNLSHGLAGSIQLPKKLNHNYESLFRRMVPFEFSRESAQSLEDVLRERTQDKHEMLEWIRKCILCKRHLQLITQNQRDVLNQYLRKNPYFTTRYEFLLGLCRPQNG